MLSKICKKCNIEKTLEYFSTEVGSHGKTYTRNTCKNCKCTQVNAETKRARHKRYSEKNKEKRKKYDKDNRQIFSKKENERYHSNPEFRLRKILRSNLKIRLKRFFQSKKGSAVKDLGCSIEELKKYLESKFKDGMTWENYGKKWHIDHIRPLSSFSLQDREQFLQACHYTNLQPLWAEENLKKSDKYEERTIS
jgi:hypothetical protein